MNSRPPSTNTRHVVPGGRGGRGGQNVYIGDIPDLWVDFWHGFQKNISIGEKRQTSPSIIATPISPPLSQNSLSSL